MIVAVFLHFLAAVMQLIALLFAFSAGANFEKTSTVSSPALLILVLSLALSVIAFSLQVIA